MADERDAATFRKLRKKSSSMSFSCFSGNLPDAEEYHRVSPNTTLTPSLNDPPSPNPYFLSPTWFRSKSSLRKGAKGANRRRHSADFSYDALSYSLNFDEGDDYFHHVTPPQRPLRDLEIPNGRRGRTRSAEISPVGEGVVKEY